MSVPFLKHTPVTNVPVDSLLSQVLVSCAPVGCPLGAVPVTLISRMPRQSELGVQLQFTLANVPGSGVPLPHSSSHSIVTLLEQFGHPTEPSPTVHVTVQPLLRLKPLPHGLVPGLRYQYW